MHLSRGMKIFLGLLGGLMVVLALAVYLFLHYDWNKAKPWLNERVSESIGRPFSIDGDLAVSWNKSDSAPPGWRGWIPWPRLVANNIQIGNPQGFAGEAGMAHADRLTF